MAQLIGKYAKKRLQDEKGMRDLVQQVAEGHKNSKVAKIRLQQLKQRMGMSNSSFSSSTALWRRGPLESPYSHAAPCMTVFSASISASAHSERNLAAEP